MRNLLNYIGLALLAVTFAFTGIEKKRIVIDVSHGGQDRGAIYKNLNEKEITLLIAKKLKALNKDVNVKIVMTRESDEFISIEDRAKMINDLKPDFVISLHANFHYDKSKNGTEIYVFENGIQIEKSKKLALAISQSFENRKVEIKNANFQLLKSVDYPIALVELGFLTNESDRALLISEEGQTEFAKILLNVIK